MSSKLDYLKRYQEKGSNKKRKKRDKNSTNFTILDDDASWISTSASKSAELGEDPDDAPIVTQVRDDSVVKWKSLPTSQIVEDGDADLSPPRLKRTSPCIDEDAEDISPPRKRKKPGQDEDLSPPRELRTNHPARHGPSSRTELLPQVEDEYQHGRKNAKDSRSIGHTKLHNKNRNKPFPRSEDSNVHQSSQDTSSRSVLGRKRTDIHENRLSCDPPKPTPVEDSSKSDDKQFMEWGRG